MRSPVVLVGCLMMMLSLGLYTFEPLFIKSLARSAHDYLVRHHGVAERSHVISLVDLDEASLDQEGQWPWPRYRVADLLKNIQEAGAKVIALDILFAEPDRTSPRRVEQDLQRAFGHSARIEGVPENLLDWDIILAKALKEGNTLLSCHMHRKETDPPGQEKQSDPNYRGYFYMRGPAQVSETLFQAEDITLSIPLLAEAAANNAFFNVVPDFDNVVRRAPLVWAMGEDRLYPSLALEAVRMYLDVPQIGIENVENAVTGIRLSNLLIPTDRNAQVVIQYRSMNRQNGRLQSSFPVISAADVLAGRLKPGQLADQIVFVGTSAVGLRDLRSTPIRQNTPGVEINATIADNILSGDLLRDPYWMLAFQIIALVCSGLLLTVIVDQQRSWLAFFIVTGILVGTLTSSVLIFRQWNLIFNPTYIMTNVVAIYPVLTTVSFWRSEKRIKWIRSHFGAMVSGKVLEHIETNPQTVTSEGQEAEATVMFSDIANFTNIAEQLHPKEISNLMELYMNPMTQIIMDHDGYVDKYIGDMIMAEWGVPFPTQDHAVLACEAVLEQIAQLEELQARILRLYSRQLNIRIGMHSGPVIAGNMGSQQRYQYTVIGDTVNLAARLEPLNKTYGTVCILSESTYQQSRHLLEVRKLDQLVVAGKTQPVWIYEMLGRKGTVESKKLQVAQLYEEAHEAFFVHGKKDEALSALEYALLIDQRDQPSVYLRERILEHLPSSTESKRP